MVKYVVYCKSMYTFVTAINQKQCRLFMKFLLKWRLGGGGGGGGEPANSVMINDVLCQMTKVIFHSQVFLVIKRLMNGMPENDEKVEIIWRGMNILFVFYIRELGHASPPKQQKLQWCVYFLAI